MICVRVRIDVECITDMSNLRWLSFNAMPFMQRFQEIGASKSLHNGIRSLKVHELR